MVRLDLLGNTIKEEKVEFRTIDKYPSLYDIHRSFDVIKTSRYDGIKGETETRMIVFTSFVLGKNSVILEGQRSSGKSNVMEIVGTYCKNSKVIDRGSDKAHKRNEDINKASHVIIPEVNKVDNSFIEGLKDWGEGKASTYTIVDKYKRTRTFNLAPKPFITSRADENDMTLGPELISRLITLKTDSSVQMNKDVISYKFKRAQNPFYKNRMSDDAVKEYRDYVYSLPDINDITFVYVPGEAMTNAIPSLFSDARRDTDKYLKNTYGICLFHYADRMITEIDGKTVMFVTPSDIWYNHIIFGSALIRSALKCSETEQKIISILKLHAQENAHDPAMRIRDIHQTLIDNGITASMTTVDNYCKNLYSNGYIVRNDNTRPHTYETSKENYKFEFNINWDDVINESKIFMEEYFPEYAEEYIKRYCTEPIEVIHPFTGKKVDIRYEEKEQLKIKKVSGPKTLIEPEKIDKDNVETSANPILIDIDNGDNDAIKLEEKYGLTLINRLKQEGEIYEKSGKCYRI